MNTSAERPGGSAGHRGKAGARGRDLRSWSVAGVLLVVGALHLLPGVALIAPARLASLYGVSGLDDDLLVLLRHRALLLALLGLFLVAAIARTSWRGPALSAALLSTVVFVLLALTVPTSPEIGRVATVDLVALPLILVGLLLSRRTRPTSPPVVTGESGRTATPEPPAGPVIFRSADVA